MIEVELDMKIVSVANMRLHWAAKARLDGDNLQSGFKAVRDGVADWLGVDDGHHLVDWQYKQRSAGPKVYRVEIEVIT